MADVWEEDQRGGLPQGGWGGQKPPPPTLATFRLFGPFSGARQRREEGMLKKRPQKFALKIEEARNLVMRNGEENDQTWST